MAVPHHLTHIHIPRLTIAVGYLQLLIFVLLPLESWDCSLHHHTWLLWYKDPFASELSCGIAHIRFQEDEGVDDMGAPGPHLPPVT